MDEGIVIVVGSIASVHKVYLGASSDYGLRHLFEVLASLFQPFEITTAIRTSILYVITSK